MHDRSKRYALFVTPAHGDTALAEIWEPRADVYRSKRGWLLKFDLAGIRPEDVTVQVTGRRVTVSGVRRDWVSEEGCCHYSMEISYSRFERTVQLPADLGSATVTVDYRDGILLVRVQPTED